MDNMREVVVRLDNDYFVTEFPQENMSEDEFIEAVIEYVMSNIQIEFN